MKPAEPRLHASLPPTPERVYPRVGRVPGTASPPPAGATGGSAAADELRAFLVYEAEDERRVDYKVYAAEALAAESSKRDR